MQVLVGRAVLAAVFGLAAAAKMGDRAGTRRALTGFGIPERFSGTGAVLLPLAELGVAAALVAGPTVPLGAAGALLLLVVFSVAVVGNLIGGRRTDCHCFGRRHPTPIGAAVVVRNAALAVLSLVVLLEGPEAAMAVAVAVAGLAVMHGMRSAGGERRATAPGEVTTDPAPMPADEVRLSRRRVMVAFAAGAVAAVAGMRPAWAGACGAECRSSADCPGTCRTCRKESGMLTGHCH